jgi:hypothetical protein
VVNGKLILICTNGVFARELSVSAGSSATRRLHRLSLLLLFLLASWQLL